MPVRRADAPWSGLESLEGRQLLATVTWDGGAGTNSWHDAQNWSTDSLPGINDDVVINVPGQTATITHSQAVFTAVHSITNNEAFSLTAGTVAASSTWKQNGAMAMSGGTVAGAGQLLAKAGFAWTGGTMSGPGQTVILAGAHLQINGPVTLARTLFNDGTLTWISGNLRFEAGTLVNRAAGTVNAQSSGAALNESGVNGIVNNGTFRRNGTGTSQTDLAVRFTNTGTVEVAQGTLRLLAGGTSFSGSFTVGEFRSLIFAGVGYVVQANAALAGPGRFVFNSATHGIAGPLNGVGELRIQGAVLKVLGPDRAAAGVTLAGGALIVGSLLTVNESMTWTGGILDGARLRLAAGGTMSLSGALEKRLFVSVLESFGTIDWSGGRIRMLDAALKNRGVFNASGAEIAGSGSVIENTGSFVKLGGGLLLLPNQPIDLENYGTGTVDVRGGTLQINCGGFSRGVITGTPAGGIAFNHQAFSIEAGVLRNLPTIAFEGPVVWLAGAIRGAGQVIVTGTLTLSGAGARELGRTLTNSGTVLWSGGGLLLIGAGILNAPGGLFEISGTGGPTTSGAASTLTNQGILKKTGSGTFSFAGATLLQIDNTGVASAEGGTLVLAAARVTQVIGTRLVGGTWNAVNGGTLDLSGVALQKNEAVVTIGGAGAAFDALASMRENLGSLNINATTFDLTPVQGSFTNSGTLRLTSGGRLNVTGHVVLPLNSKLVTGLSSPSVFGRITASATVEFAGLATAFFTYTPAVGTAFDFVTGSGRSGEFTSRTTIGLPAGLDVAIEYALGVARWRVQAG